MNLRRKLEIINTVLDKIRKEVEEELEQDSGWFGPEDIDIPERITPAEYDDNMLLLSYADRGGISVSLMYRDETDEEDYEDMRDADYEHTCHLEVRDGKIILK